MGGGTETSSGQPAMVRCPQSQRRPLRSMCSLCIAFRVGSLRTHTPRLGSQQCQISAPLLTLAECCWALSLDVGCAGAWPLLTSAADISIVVHRCSRVVGSIHVRDEQVKPGRDIRKGKRHEKIQIQIKTRTLTSSLLITASLPTTVMLALFSSMPTVLDLVLPPAVGTSPFSAPNAPSSYSQSSANGATEKACVGKETANGGP